LGELRATPKKDAGGEKEEKSKKNSMIGEKEEKVQV